MAPFVTTDEMRAVLARDTERPGILEDLRIDDTEIEKAIASAHAEVVARVSSRYPQVGSEEPPQLLVDLTEDIAAYLLVLRYQHGEMSEDDLVYRRYFRAREMLQAIFLGQVDLPVEDDDSGVIAGKPINRYEGTLFSMEDFNLGCGPRRRGHWWQ